MTSGTSLQKLFSAPSRCKVEGANNTQEVTEAARQTALFMETCTAQVHGCAGRWGSSISHAW